MNVRASPDAVARAVEWEFAQSRYAAVLADVPPALYRCWADAAHRELPGIPRDASFYAQAMEGLMMFFDCASSARRECALPSLAAESVWHAWICMDAPGLERFCIRHFGRTVPHVQKAQMKHSMDRALAVCLVQARRRASQPVAGAHLPRLFSLDAQLGMPGGFAYGIVGGVIACSILDEFGNPGDGMRFPRELAPRGLLDAGLISGEDYREATGKNPPDTHLASSGSDDGSVDGDGACGDRCGGDGCGS